MKKNGLLMAKMLGAFLASSLSMSALAQISFGGQPASFSIPQSHLRADLAPHTIHVLPDFNPDDVRARSEWNAQEVGVRPLTVGQIIKTNIDFARDAESMRLPDGQIIYRLAIDTRTAKGVALMYDDFFIPKGAGELYLYTPDHKEVLGRYTYETNPTHGSFATEPLPGSSVIMEYVPAAGGEMPSILISGVAYIFAENVVRNDPNPGEDNSDETCQVNINCPDGADWQTQKAGVVQMYMAIGSQYGICSGNLLNNTAGDFKPLIISAAHCASLTGTFTPTPIDLNKWIFSFHYEKPGCSNGQKALPRRKTMTGCTMKSFLPIKGQSDGLLLELKREIPLSYRVYYNGWDRTGTLISKGAGIHHPAGDAKKISILNSTVTNATWNSEEKGADNAHFYFKYQVGGTEGGSSGSSLFNEAKLVVGTLTGGSGKCASATEFYGKLQAHWDQFKEAGKDYTQMASFLDPKNTGAPTLQGTWRENMRPLDAIKDLKIERDGDNLKVTWSPVSKEGIPAEWTVKYRIYRNGRYLDGKDVTDGTTFTESMSEALAGYPGNVIYGVQARYLYNGAVITTENYGDADIVELGVYAGNTVKTVTPTVVNNTYGSKKGKYLTWSAANNLQEVSLFGYPSNLSFSAFNPSYITKGLFGEGAPATVPARAYVASKFPSYYFQNFSTTGDHYIYAISYVPTTKAKGDYKVYIRNGEYDQKNIYEQDFDVPDTWNKGEWVTVKLNKPFKVANPNKSLYIGFSVKNLSGRTTPGVEQVVGSADTDLTLVDGLASFNLGESFVARDRWRHPVSGYLAMRVMVSNTGSVDGNSNTQFFSRGKQPVPFPQIKGYRIKRDGVVIADNVQDREYTDEAGTDNSTYEVEVIYNEQSYIVGNQEVEAITALPYVFPSRLAADATLNISDANRVTKLSIYAMDGALVYTETAPAERISLAELAEGTYLVVLDTPQGKASQRVIR